MVREPVFPGLGKGKERWRREPFDQQADVQVVIMRPFLCCERRRGVAAKALSGMRRCIPSLQAPYFHMASLSMVLLLMILCAGCTSDDEAEAPVPPQGQDSPAPVATIIFPGSSALLTSAPITVRGTVQDQSAITSVAVNGVPATSTDGFATWAAQVTLPLGMNEVVVSTRDEIGNAEVRAAVAMVTVVETLLPFLGPTGIAVEPSGTLVVVDNGLRAVVRVDPQTGARTIISDATTGSGPALVRPIAIAVEASTSSR